MVAQNFPVSDVCQNWIHISQDSMSENELELDNLAQSCNETFLLSVLLWRLNWLIPFRFVPWTWVCPLPALTLQVSQSDKPLSWKKWPACAHYYCFKIGWRDGLVAGRKRPSSARLCRGQDQAHVHGGEPIECPTHPQQSPGFLGGFFAKAARVLWSFPLCTFVDGHTVWWHQ